MIDIALGATAAGLVPLVLWANSPIRETASTPPTEAAREAVRADPLRPAALRDLALALDRQGDRREAAPLMAFAGERSKRDTATTLWLMRRALEEDRYDEAFAQVDALLRRDIEAERRERLYALLTAAAAVDAARPALESRLAARPWWRESFLRELAAKGEPAPGEAVLAALRRAGAGPTSDEVQAFLVRRVAERDFAGATREGAALLGAGARDVNDLTTPPPLGWSSAEGEGASSTVEDGRLAVTYDGFASPSLPRRLLALGPGAWRIAFQHRTPDGGPPRLELAVRCAEGAVLVRSPPLPVSTTWRSESLAFAVPTTGCAGQWLAIVPDPGERRETMETDFADWALTAAPNGPRPH